VGHVAHMGEGRGVYKFCFGGPQVRDRWEDVGIGKRWILEREGLMGQTGFGWLRIGSSGGLL